MPIFPFRYFHTQQHPLRVYHISESAKIGEAMFFPSHHCQGQTIMNAPIHHRTDFGDLDHPLYL